MLAGELPPKTRACDEKGWDVVGWRQMFLLEKRRFARDEYAERNDDRSLQSLT